MELDVSIGSALVNCHSKFGLMEHAQVAFEELWTRDVVLWNAMVNGYAQIGQFAMVLKTFRRMNDEGVVPSRFTVTGVLSVFAETGELDNGRIIHGFSMNMGYDSGIAVSNSLIDMYGKCKCVEDALEIFEMMSKKDVFSWNSIISVYEQCGDYDGTLRLFDRMLGAGIQPDLVTVTIVLPACFHLAALMHGREIHGYMIVSRLGKDGKDVDVVLLKNAVMDNWTCMQNAGV